MTIGSVHQILGHHLDRLKVKGRPIESARTLGSQDPGIFVRSIDCHVWLRQITQTPQIERRQKLRRSHKRMRRAGSRTFRPIADQVLVTQPSEQMAVDFLAKDVGEPCPVDGLVVSDSAEHGHFFFGKVVLMSAAVLMAVA